MRKADRVFAYTPAGAKYAMSRGVASDRVTTVMNSLDIAELMYAASLIRDRMTVRARFGVEVQSTCLAYVGGLDASKRIDFLVRALDHLWAAGADVHVLVGGKGSDEALLRPASARGQATMLGRVGPREKADLLTAADAVVMPGRIGLVAVEALAMGCPIVTTSWRYHAPEFEYLTEGVNVFSSADDALKFAELLRRARSFGRSEPLRWEFPNLASMTSNFAGGVKDMLTRGSNSVS